MDSESETFPWSDDRVVSTNSSVKESRKHRKRHHHKHHHHKYNHYHHPLSPPSSPLPTTENSPLSPSRDASPASSSTNVSPPLVKRHRKRGRLHNHKKERTKNYKNENCERNKHKLQNGSVDEDAADISGDECDGQQNAKPQVRNSFYYFYTRAFEERRVNVSTYVCFPNN